MRLVRVITSEENKEKPSIEIVTPPIHIPSSVHVPPPVNNIESKKGDETCQHDDPKKLMVTSPTFPRRLVIPGPIIYLDFHLVGELKKIVY